MSHTELSDERSRLSIGGNRPPLPTQDEIKTGLEVENEELIQRARDLYKAAVDTPLVCDDEELAGKITERISLISKTRKAIEAQREKEKEPFMTLERTVDGVFRPARDGLDQAKKKLETVLGSYIRKKADEERRRREEDARREREDAERIAREKREEAERLRREADDRAAAAAAQEAAQMQSLAGKSLNQAVANEKQAETLEKEALKAEKVAIKAEKAAEAKPSQMAAVHGSYGSRANLRTKKISAVTSREELDIEALRTHFKADALEAAVKSWMDANWKDQEDPPILSGASFHRDDIANVRG